MSLKVNSAKLMELLESFYTLTKIRITIFDDEFKEIISYPEHHCEYCALIKQNPITKKQCDRCDVDVFDKCKKTGLLQIHKCHAGLIDVAAPIKENNVILGYVMFGQILDTKDKQAAFNEIEKSLRSYETDIGLLKEAFLKLSYRSSSQIKAASQIMEACACYLWLSELVLVKMERVINKINKYIDQHLEEQFTVSEICKELNISRSKLYQISKQYFGMGLGEYIKKKRISKAKEILCDTDYSINDVAAMCGICDYNYFYKVFKKETGLSPSQFQKQNKR